MANNNPNAATGESLPEPVTYGSYKFRGFTPPGFEPDFPSTSLHDEVTTDGSGTYTEDTKEYRIAKMLHECEDYLVMDSIIYHYLFIERHLMVDNVAKNTFWSTEDGTHWDLTKNYDNDTADGNNNTGELVFSYGLEVGDKDSNGASVFNAINSVWLTFVHELKNTQKIMYDKLNSYKINNAGIWDY